MTPKTPTKNQNQGSPRKFIRPADLFKLQIKSTKTITLTPSNLSNSSNPGANIRFHLHSSPLGGFNQPKLPLPVVGSPTFKRISAAHHIEPPSPLKCLSNLDPSPTKKIPTVLKNPFDKPVKRRLNLSPKKAIKRSKMLALDEDANLEPPKTKPIVSPTKGGNNCSNNDWTLKTKLKVRFDNYCKNWNDKSSTTHHREFHDDSSSSSDCTISLEAIKNVATVYQHPYLPWLPLYPRSTGFFKKDTATLDFMKSEKFTKALHNDWRESLDDIANLLIEGRCPYFYLCSDNYNALFKQKSGSPQVCISPFAFGMASELNKLRIEFKYPGARLPILSTKETSPFTTPSSSQSTQPRPDNSVSRDRTAAPSSIDSGHYSECSGDELEEDVDEDASQILQGIGLSEKDVSVVLKPKGFAADAESNTQSSSQVPLAIIEGVDNLRKFIKFLKTNRLYTMNNLGKFAHVPPTLLAPNQFRYSTPLVPQILLSQNVMDRNKSPTKSGLSRLMAKSASPSRSKSNSTVGPAFIEISGTVLPDLHKDLHNMLVLSKNEDHICQSTILESSAPFSTIEL